MKSSKRNTVRHIYGPGIWEDEDGNPHFSLPDLLKHVDLDDTPENRKTATAMIKDMFKDRTFIERSTPEE